MTIRDMAAQDLVSLLNIYNEAVACSTALYRDMPSTIGERSEWFEAGAKQGYPVVVDAQGSFINGFGTFGDFRPWSGLSVHGRAFGVRPSRCPAARDWEPDRRRACRPSSHLG